MRKQPYLVQAGSPGTYCNKTIKDIETDSAACCWSDVRDWGKKSNMVSLVVIPSCTPCMSSLFFEAFPYNKGIKDKRQILGRVGKKTGSIKSCHLPYITELMKRRNSTGLWTTALKLCDSSKCFSGVRCLNSTYEYEPRNSEGKNWEMQSSGEKKMLRLDSDVPH